MNVTNLVDEAKRIIIEQSKRQAVDSPRQGVDRDVFAINAFRGRASDNRCFEVMAQLAIDKIPPGPKLVNVRISVTLSPLEESQK